jgi:hypothetical protein
LEFGLLSEELGCLSVVISSLLPHLNLFAQVQNHLGLLILTLSPSSGPHLKLAYPLLPELDNHLVSRALLLIAFHSLLDSLGLLLPLLYLILVVLLLRT